LDQIEGHRLPVPLFREKVGLFMPRHEDVAMLLQNPEQRRGAGLLGADPEKFGSMDEPPRRRSPP
jgi:hypothetical protein